MRKVQFVCQVDGLAVNLRSSNDKHLGLTGYLGKRFLQVLAGSGKNHIIPPGQGFAE